MINRQLAMQIREASDIAQEHEQYLSRWAALKSQLRRPRSLPQITSDVLKWAFVVALCLWAVHAYQSWARLRTYKRTLAEWEEYAESEASFVATLNDISEEEAREIVDNYSTRPGDPPFYFPESVLEMLFFIVIGGILIFGLIFGTLYLYNKNLNTLNRALFGRENASRRAKNRATEAQMQQYAQQLGELRQRYNSLGFPDVYFSSAVLRRIGEYVAAGRAQNFSQAANLYEQDEKHNRQLAEARRAQNQLTEQLERHHHAQMMSDMWLQASIDDLKRK